MGGAGRRRGLRVRGKGIEGRMSEEEGSSRGVACSEYTVGAI